MLGSSFLVGLVLTLGVVGACITWLGLILIDKHGPGPLPYLCLTFGNALIVFPSIFAFLGHDMRGYFVGLLISGAISVYLLWDVKDPNEDYYDDDE